MDLQELLVHEEFSELAVSAFCLSHGGQHTSQLALSLVLLIQELSGQPIREMIVIDGFQVVNVVGALFTLDDDLADRFGDLGFQIESILNGVGSRVPGHLVYALHNSGWDNAEHMVMIVSQVSSHGQIGNELDSMLSLLTSTREEELGKSRPVDAVT